MSADEKPVELDFAVHWCARHLEPFRAGWPAGAGVAMLRLFEAAMASEAFQAAGANIPAEGFQGGLDALLREHAPLCCLVGDDAMAAIYGEAGKEPPR